MKKLISSALIGVTLMYSTTSCIGSFKLTNKVFEWNKSVGEKFVNELVFLGLVILPVYGLSLFIDGIILNSIEFWSGSNPVSMKEGEKEIQYVKNESGDLMKITATKNKFSVEAVDGKNAGKVEVLEFSPEEQSWSHVDSKKQKTKLMQFEENGEVVIVFHPNGKSLRIKNNEANHIKASRATSLETAQLELVNDNM